MEMNRVRDLGSSGIRKRSGFTLIELMGVIVIMMILAGITLGIAGYASRKADEARAQAELQEIRNALEEYRLEHGAYPGALGGLEYSVSRDPWGSAYQYETHGRFSYDLYSHGPSGASEEYDQIR